MSYEDWKKECTKLLNYKTNRFNRLYQKMLIQLVGLGVTLDFENIFKLPDLGDDKEEGILRVEGYQLLEYVNFEMMHSYVVFAQFLPNDRKVDQQCTCTFFDNKSSILDLICMHKSCLLMHNCSINNRDGEEIMKMLNISKEFINERKETDEKHQDNN